MLINHNPDEYETVTKYSTCDYHKKHPGASWAGCTCSGSISQIRKKTPNLETITLNSLKRLGKLVRPEDLLKRK